MADIILSPILQVFLDKLASPVLETVSNMLDVKENVQKLHSKLPLIQALLEDAEEQQVTNAAVRIWLSKLKDVGHDVEDLLVDCVAIHDAAVPDALYAARVRKTLGELDLVVDEGLHLNLRERRTTVRGESDRRETSYFVVESDVYGREVDKEKIVELLLSCEGNEKGRVSCIPIVGMGGLGKTTLAQLAYNDQKVTQHFDVKVWVFVSDQFDVKKIMMGIIECLTKDGCRYSNMSALHSEVWSLLHKKRFLIVLDDVWTEDQDDWDKLRPLYKGGIDGSKILITTRSMKVALVVDCPTFPYYLKGLSEDACWSLFKQRAFRPGEGEAHQNLLAIGKQIVRKCGGVALAAKSLGSLMRFKREESEWLSVQESEIWNLDEGESGIVPALRLSYSRLPPHLKRCFSSCSVFPKGYEIKKQKLILMWIAQGLVQSNEGKIQPEDVGNEYFNNLLWMSFFQETKQPDNGIAPGYKMHDVIYDLAQSMVGSDYAILEHGSPSPTRFDRIRHCSVVCEFNSSSIPEEVYKATRLRTLLFFFGENLSEVPLKLYSSFKYLLVLNLSGCGIFNIDASIFQLASLRDLDLSHTRIKQLPTTIADLPYLQSLNLFNCYELTELPDILQMKSLRHLNNGGCEALTKTLPIFSLPSGLLNLEKREMLLNLLRQCLKELQTFPLLVVGRAPDIMLLGQLNQLQGSLKITQLENVSVDDARHANLIKKKRIESLGLYWGKDDDHESPSINPEEESNAPRLRKRSEMHSPGSSQGLKPDASMGEQVLANLQPHHNLKRLLVKGYPGIKFPSWKVSYLKGYPNIKFPFGNVSYLKRVDLIECREIEHLPTLGNLEFLSCLSLQVMHRVKSIGTEFYGNVKKPFPVLKELVLVDFPVMEEWLSPDGKDAFLCLDKLTVAKCLQLNVMPQILSIQHLELRDCRANLFHSFQNLASLRTLVIDKVRDLFCFPGLFPTNNSLLASLEIKSCPQLHSLPPELGNLTTLKSLTLRWCKKLSSLPPSLMNLNALECLEIGDCHGLAYLLENEAQGLSNLRTLSIENCNNLTSLSMGFKYLTSLESLTIMYCPSLCKLPRGIEHLSSLRSLTILSCPQLVPLPEELQNLTGLHSLEIRSCPSLDALPDWIDKLVSLRSFAISDCLSIASLPEGIEHLAALQHLSIQDCPRLVERCRQESGEDWPKIAHVPYKHIVMSEQMALRSEAASSSLN